MRCMGKADLGATTLCASTQARDECGSNGLPLTPNGIRVLGQFQKLKTLDHPRLCKYIDIVRGKHERVIIVSEHYRSCLSNWIKSETYQEKPQEVNRIAYEVLQGLDYLNQQGLAHRKLAPQHILIDSNGHVKLCKYGLYYMTHHGADVCFPLGDPSYLAPEVLCQGPVVLTDLCPRSDEPRRVCQPHSGPKVDVWSLGIILLELTWGIKLWSGCSLKQLFYKIFSFLKTDMHPVNIIARQHDKESTLQDFPPELLHVIKLCLTVSPSKRPEPSTLLEHALFKEFRVCKLVDLNGYSMFSTKLRCKDLELPSPEDSSLEEPEDHLAGRSLEDVYYLWRLAGGDLEGVLRKAGLIRSDPPVTKLAKFTVEEGEMFHEPTDRSTLLDGTVVILPMDQLRQRLKHIDEAAYYPLLEEDRQEPSSHLRGMQISQSSGDLLVASKLPLIIREKDVEYQFHRVMLYSRLLQGYPYTKTRILKEARSDIPPVFRAQIWAAILAVQGDIQGAYDNIDKETPTATDRQIEVDVPRCHQYNELLCSPSGHQKFKRILKAWVIGHPEYVYWQGLDSLCAPFLHLNFTNEALALACLAAFIPKYLYKFFLKDNSAVIQEYLAVFSHLVAFHDPELSNHLNRIGFVPELYAIPWFLTMYAHVFPLHKIFHLWDTLLLGNSSFPLYIGVSILQQLRDQLLSFGFNECILLFSDMPQIDIERVVQESVRLFRCTPRSTTYRQHAAPESSRTNSSNHMTVNSSSAAHLAMDNITLEDKKKERCPRISAEDLVKLSELHLSGASPAHSKRNHGNRSEKPPLVVIDIRPQEDYIRGTISGSVNIPHSTAFSTEGSLTAGPAATLQTYKTQIKVIVGGQGTGAFRFAESLLDLGYSKLCVLHKGADGLKNTGYLTVPPATEF